MFRSLLSESPSSAHDLTGGDSRTAEVEISARTARDLELDLLVEQMVHPGAGAQNVRAILTRLPNDTNVIRYRQMISHDLWAHPGLCDRLASLLESMRELTVFSRSAGRNERPLLEAAWRLGELELYVSLVDELHDALSAFALDSTGLLSLRDELGRRREEPAFVELRGALPRLRSGIRLRRSVTIGVNLDERLRPVAAALLSVNDKQFEEAQFLKGFFSAAGRDPYVTQTPLHRTAPGSLLDTEGDERLPLSPLFQELEDVLRSMLRPLAKELRAYVGLSTALFRSLLPELGFYLGAIAFLRRVADAGRPISFPDLHDPAERRTAFHGLYNLYLAAHRMNAGDRTAIVTNDLVLDENARLFVLTGPNGGGKTTFTQAAGIAAVFAQSGLPVPAESAVISPVDAVVTHFPIEEDYNDDLGRFEDEVRRVSEIFDQVGEESLVLLNEPLSSTGPKEAVEVAADVLAGFRIAGARGVFTTHLHQLADHVEQLNSAVTGSSCIGTLNAGVRAEGDRAVRTYRITAGASEGSSYAGDIARRFGIDLATLQDRIMHRSRERDGTPRDAPGYQRS